MSRVGAALRDMQVCCRALIGGQWNWLVPTAGDCQTSTCSKLSPGEFNSSLWMHTSGPCEVTASHWTSTKTECFWCLNWSEEWRLQQQVRLASHLAKSYHAWVCLLAELVANGQSVEAISWLSWWPIGSQLGMFADWACSQWVVTRGCLDFTGHQWALSRGFLSWWPMSYHY